MSSHRYELDLKLIEGAEIVHHADENIKIFSYFNKVSVISKTSKVSFRLPLPLVFRLLGYFRLFRRFLRLDKSSIAISNDKTSLVIIYYRNVYHFCLRNHELKKTMRLKQCKTLLHGGIASIEKKTIIFGEYGRNPNRDSVPIYLSEDGGLTWQNPFSFPAGKIRHVHGIHYDEYTNHIWVPTGDFEGECYLYEFSNLDFTEPKIHGDGSQTWRTVSLFFTKDSIIWGMDSELETSNLIIMDRLSGLITKKQEFPAPVWYIKSLTDGKSLLQTTVEKGASVKTNKVHLFLSEDLKNWTELAKLEHDGLPLGLFKNSVLAFASGYQSSQKFYFSAEAIKGMDGKSFECVINKVG